MPPKQWAFVGAKAQTRRLVVISFDLLRCANGQQGGQRGEILTTILGHMIPIKFSPVVSHINKTTSEELKHLVKGYCLL